jgi:hypothetical protein
MLDIFLHVKCKHMLLIFYQTVDHGITNKLPSHIKQQTPEHARVFWEAHPGIAFHITEAKRLLNI